MKLSWLDTQVSPAFGLHKKTPSSSKKPFLEAKARRALLRPPALMLCLAGAAKCVPGPSPRAGKLPALPPPRPGRAGWQGPTSALGPGVLQCCWPVQGDCAQHVQHAPCSQVRFQAGWALDKVVPGSRLLIFGNPVIFGNTVIFGNPGSHLPHTAELCWAEGLWGKWQMRAAPKHPPGNSSVGS